MSRAWRRAARDSFLFRRRWPRWERPRARVSWQSVARTIWRLVAWAVVACAEAQPPASADAGRAVSATVSATRAMEARIAISSGCRRPNVRPTGPPSRLWTHVRGKGQDHAHD